MNKKIHPDDFIGVAKNELTSFKLFLKMDKADKLSHKLINEFRILNVANKYVRVIEQRQVLELDQQANVWLALSILDISPNQNINENYKSQLFNFKTSRFVSLLPNTTKLKVQLTKRETEILRLVKSGLLSKEISNHLCISIHTVNTHRQRVLEKLSVSNSMEAVLLSSKLGLI